MSTIYTLSKITKSYKSLDGEADFKLSIDSLSIDKGTVVGIYGPNGSGKTTLLKILSFVDRADSGVLFFRGKRYEDLKMDDKRMVTFLPQDAPLFKRNVKNNVSYGLRVRGEGKRDEIISRALLEVGLDPSVYLKKKWFELSGGERKRVAFAARLVLNPEILILDEPTSDVDADSVERFRTLIVNLKKSGKTVIVSSHDMSWLAGVSDRVVSLYDGRVIGEEYVNHIMGPWVLFAEDVFYKRLDDGQRIFSISPPFSSSVGLLFPSDIVISRKEIPFTSAKNVIRGKVTNIELYYGIGQVMVTLVAGGQYFRVVITHSSAVDLEIEQGKDYWLIFKASSIKWV